MLFLLIFTYDKIADALYIKFSNKKIVESLEIQQGIIIDYAEDNTIAGIEILNYSRRKINLNNLIKLTSDEIVTELTKIKIDKIGAKK